jgi:hypothetical protein
MTIVRLVARATALLAMFPAAAMAEARESVRDSSGSAIWIFANLSYAGMRAQGSKNGVWRVISFIFGFPGTLVSMFFVDEGSERVYGVDMLRNPAAAPKSG